MNVIVANKYQAMLSGLEIDIIKTMYGEYEVDEIIDTFSNFFFNKMILDITAIKNYKDINNLQKLSMNLDMSKVILVLDESEESSAKPFLSSLVSMGIYNFSRNLETIKYLINNPHTYKDVASIQQLEDRVIPTSTGGIDSSYETFEKKIIGIKNVTDHAGASTLIYMMKKQLQENYSTIAIEVNRHDFGLFNDNEMISTTADNLPREILKNKDYDVILVDLNDMEDDGTCPDVLYLIEPSTIKLNKMIRKNRNIFEKLKGKKIILNQSLLNDKDIDDFEYESKSEIYFNLPPLDDKKNKHDILNTLLFKLGFIKQEQPEKKEDNKLLGIFGKR